MKQNTKVKAIPNLNLRRERELRNWTQERLALFRAIGHEQAKKVARWLETLPED